MLKLAGQGARFSFHQQDRITEQLSRLSGLPAKILWVLLCQVILFLYLIKCAPDEEKDIVHSMLPNLEPGGAEHIVITLLRYFDRSVFEITLIVLASASGSLGAKVPKDVPRWL